MKQQFNKGDPIISTALCGMHDLRYIRAEVIEKSEDRYRLRLTPNGREVSVQADDVHSGFILDLSSAAS